MAKHVIDLLVEVYNDYRGYIEFGVWPKGKGRYYIEVDIKDPIYHKAEAIAEDLKTRLAHNGMWFKQLGPLKWVVKRSGVKLWRFCARVRDFTNPPY